jgi:hypothetical protein
MLPVLPRVGKAGPRARLFREGASPARDFPCPGPNAYSACMKIFAPGFGVVLACLSLLASKPGLAQTAASPRMVIELFTSQGCSSCPPADALLSELASRPDVIALSMPVDYWDYLGWKDTLAKPAFSARQKAYSAARGDRQVYTPQAVIDGVIHAVGSDRTQIETAAKSAQNRAGVMLLPVSIADQDGAYSVTVGAGAAASSPSSAQVFALPVIRRRDVAIGRGENANRKVTYVNIVRDMILLGEWSGAQKSYSLARSAVRGDNIDGFVVLVQTGTPARPGMIMGAAKSAGL